MLPLQSMLDKTLRANRLFDFYGPLLTENQRRIFRLYYREDWSLSEVAESMECSRQAVHESVQRGHEKMQSFDDKLSLIEEHQHRQSKLNELLTLLNGNSRARERVEEMISQGL